MKTGPWLFLAVICLFLAGCSGQARAEAAGDPTAGETLFHQASIREAPACASCHSTEPGKDIVGPSLAGIAARAGERIPGVAAQDYIRQSITNPNAYIVEGFPSDVMYPDFEAVLTEAEIYDLIAYLMTLE